MNIDISRPWREVFALAAEAKAEEKRNKHHELMLKELDRQDREKRLAVDKQEKKKEEKERTFEQMLATAERLADFSIRLDDLDTALVSALMHNGEGLDHAHAQIEAMLDRADKLPDGRRIFKTEDGTRVFDEHGAELPSDVIDLHAVDDHCPHWEPFRALKENEAKLQVERRELLDYQNKLDQARARLDKGGVTNKELDALDADLKSTMPPSFRDDLRYRGAAVDGPGTEVQDSTATVQRDRLRIAVPTGPSPM